MLKTIAVTILNFLINKLPDTWKIIIGVFVLGCIGLYFLRGIGIQESKAYSNSLQELNNHRFEAMIRHSDARFNLLRDDINSLRQQNNDIIKLLIKQNKEN